LILFKISENSRYCIGQRTFPNNYAGQEQLFNMLLFSHEK